MQSSASILYSHSAYSVTARLSPHLLFHSPLLIIRPRLLTILPKSGPQSQSCFAFPCPIPSSLSQSISIFISINPSDFLGTFIWILPILLEFRPFSPFSPFQIHFCFTHSRKFPYIRTYHNENEECIWNIDRNELEVRKERKIPRNCVSPPAD